MTFLSPAKTAGNWMPFPISNRKPARMRGRSRVAGEDSARRAFGEDGQVPALALSGISIEDLARVALG